MTLLWSQLFDSSDLSKHSKDFAHIFEHDEAARAGNLESLSGTFNFGETDSALEDLAPSFRFGEPDSTLGHLDRSCVFNEASSIDNAALWHPDPFDLATFNTSPLLTCLSAYPLIRHKIWRLATDENIDVIVNDHWASIYPVTPLLRTCKLIRNDFLHMVKFEPELIQYTINEPQILRALDRFTSFPTYLPIPQNRVIVRLKLAYPLLEGPLRDIILKHGDTKEKIRADVMKLWNIGFYALVKLRPQKIVIDANVPWELDMDIGLEMLLPWNQLSHVATARMREMYLYWKRIYKELPLFWVEGGEEVEWPWGVTE